MSGPLKIGAEPRKVAALVGLLSPVVDPVDRRFGRGAAAVSRSIRGTLSFARNRA